MPSRIAFDEIRENAEIPPLKIDLSATRNQDYCNFVGEINPLHFDRKYARSLGYRDIVVAGIFTASLFPKLITDWLGGRARIERMEVRFEAPAYLDETVTYRGRVTRKWIEKNTKSIACDVWSQNTASERLASATLLLSFRDEANP